MPPSRKIRRYRASGSSLIAKRSLVEETHELHLIRNRQRRQCRKRDVHRTALDSAKVLGVNADSFGRFLLRQPGFLTKPAQPLPELTLLARDDAFERSTPPYLGAAMGIWGGRAAHLPTGLRESSLELHNS